MTNLRTLRNAAVRNCTVGWNLSQTRFTAPSRLADINFSFINKEGQLPYSRRTIKRARVQRETLAGRSSCITVNKLERRNLRLYTSREINESSLGRARWTLVCIIPEALDQSETSWLPDVERAAYIEPATFKGLFEASEGVPLMFYRRFRRRDR